MAYLSYVLTGVEVLLRVPWTENAWCAELYVVLVGPRARKLLLDRALFMRLLHSIDFLGLVGVRRLGQPLVFRFLDQYVLIFVVVAFLQPYRLLLCCLVATGRRPGPILFCVLVRKDSVKFFKFSKVVFAPLLLDPCGEGIVQQLLLLEGQHLVELRLGTVEVPATEVSRAGTRLRLQICSCHGILDQLELLELLFIRLVL